MQLGATLYTTIPPPSSIENDATLGWVCEPAFTIALSSRVSGWGWYTTQYYRVYDLSLH